MIFFALPLPSDRLDRIEKDLVTLESAIKQTLDLMGQVIEIIAPLQVDHHTLAAILEAAKAIPVRKQEDNPHYFQ